MSPRAKVPIARRLFHGMRTEGGGPGREALAIGLGFLIGCTPLYGFHLLMVLGVGSLLRLNRLKMYLAANVSNPVFAPLLVLLQVQAGAWLRRGRVHALTIDTVRTMDPWTFGLDLIVGSLVIGVGGGALAASATYMSSRRRRPLDEVLMAAADRYLQAGVVAWEFARGKLRGDPIYREILVGNHLQSGGALLDVGCGQGLALAALAEARRRLLSGTWPEPAAKPPVFDAMIGIELRPRIARLAQQALDADAAIQIGDASAIAVPPARAVLLFDVLHLMSKAQQEALLRSLALRVAPGGVILVREADAAGGLAFQVVRLGNRLKAIVTGRWKQSFAFRTRREWLQLFALLGLDAEVRPMGSGTPFANVLFTLTPQLTAPAPILRS